VQRLFRNDEKSAETQPLTSAGYDFQIWRGKLLELLSEFHIASADRAGGDAVDSLWLLPFFAVFELGSGLA
jgi:hypothetical protein